MAALLIQHAVTLPIISLAIGAAFTAVSALLVWGLPETRGKVLAT